MIRSLLHTPEGVRDIYNQECVQKLVLQDRLSRLMIQYGYGAIQTPTFEFFDIFSREIGTTPSKDLYKFFDREGNTLVLRPDITPSVARAAAKYFAQEDMPIRLWYQGSTFINNSSYQGRLKESTQLGAELIGDNSVDADAETLSLVANALKAAGLKEFQISIGHVDILKGLEEAAGLDSETIEELEELFSNKNFFGVEELIAPLALPENLKALFVKLGTLYDDGDSLQELLEPAASYPVIVTALLRLQRLYELLKLYEVEQYITLEPGMITGYRYYTGIIFAGYTFGSGEPIVKGGRYDDLLPYFGKQSPSIGFAVVVDQLLAALSRQKIKPDIRQNCILLVYEPHKQTEAITKARTLREQGAEVLLTGWQENKTKGEYQEYGRRMGCATAIFL